MKKVFTLALVMAMAITGIAQVRSLSYKDAIGKPVQKQVFRGTEEAPVANFAQTRGIVSVDPEAEDLNYSTYDWQTNAGPRNYVAVWPDGYAVMALTLATETNFSDRGTGLAWYDPAVGSWSFKATRAEGVKTGFGSIARYKENGLVIAAHTANDLRIFIAEDFRSNPTQDFGEGIILPAPNNSDPCWPVVQCSGENLDIIHVLCTDNGATAPYSSPLIYYRYENGSWTHEAEILPTMTANELSDGGSNIAYFILYDPAKPNRVGFVLNNAWSDCKAVISEDNGDTWADRVFYQHPGINTTIDSWFFYPRWTNVAFDNDDNLCVLYAYNGSTGEPGSGSYYPGIGGIGYWSEILPKNELCVGGIGNVGEPFIMDTTYLIEDIYSSSIYWSDQLHDPLPEYVGDLVCVDEEGHVVSFDDPDGLFPSSNTLSWGEHGKYNSGRADFATMFYDKERNYICAFWSMIAGDAETLYVTEGLYYYRLFCNISYDGGMTWEGAQQVSIGFENSMTEYAYDQMIPYMYGDADGLYVWVLSQVDGYPGTFVQGDEADPSDNHYQAYKVYLNYMDDVEENIVKVGTTINVYPNPAQGSFNVTLNNESDVNIYNAVGQLVKSFNNVKEVNVNLEAGVYFVNANNQTKKVVVK